MKWLWTWGGKNFGYQESDRLFTHYGKQVGRFDGSTIYRSDGQYLGELYQDRLITHLSKKTAEVAHLHQFAEAPIRNFQIILVM